MAQNIRNLLNQNPEETKAMPKGHEKRFLKKLEEHLPKQKSKFSMLNIAASITILLGISYGVFQFYNTPVQPKQNDFTISTLSDISPDLKKVEDYYLASINLELSNVELTPINKELFDGYMERLKILNNEYKTLTEELTTNGLNEASLNALIDNLKYRLNLVTRLRVQLQELNDTNLEQSI